jgi:hypothetical protein
MTQDEIEARATDRAAGEHLHTFRLAGGTSYLVKSRRIDPGAMHVVRVDQAGQVMSCSDCPGWQYRQSCIHAAAVQRRLEREARRPKPVSPVAPVEPTPITSACRGRSQLYREA